MLSAARFNSDVARVLLDAVAEGSLAPGVAADLADRLVDDVECRDLGLDEPLELAAVGSRT